MSVLKTTPVDAIPKIVENVRNTFNTGKTRPVEYRIRQLLQLHKLVKENKEALYNAVFKDLHKPKEECELTELAMISGEIADAVEHLEEWVKPHKPSVNLINALDGCQVTYDPLGTVLIIGAWNYPFQLTLVPLIGAIAAGNTAILKPSEISANSAQILADLIPKYLDPAAYQVINGAVAETTAVLEQKFDHIMYTGNGAVGKIILAAAAKHLCPCTLELGGKSPTIVDENVDMKIVARRVVWGRFMNCGQTCIAPDYVLIHERQKDSFVKHVQEAISEFYGKNPQESNSLSRIVNINHFRRIKNLIDTSNGKVVIGGQTDEKDLYIAPTIITDVPIDAPIMQQEIFGPVLPVITIKNIDEAISFVNQRDKPLALYVFSNNNSVVNAVLTRTSSGGFIANDTIMHAAVPQLPFGGVGPSGMGAYHGKLTFELFSHKKAVMLKQQSLEAVNNIRYPPYSAKKMSWISKLLFKEPKEPSFKLPLKPIFFVLVAAIAYLRFVNPNLINFFKS